MTAAGRSVLDAASEVRVPKAAELVAAHLRRLIVRGVLRDGQALPHEPVLTQQFGVSRPTLREALGVLESQGLIRIHRGSGGGAHVQAPDADVVARYAGLVLEFRHATLEDVLMARALVEPALAASVARDHNRDAVDDLRTAHEQECESSVSGTLGLGVHDRFHDVLIASCRNHAVAVLGNTVHRILTMMTSRVECTAPDPDAAHSHLKDHAKLIVRIEEGDASGARRLWARHLSKDRRFAAIDQASRHVDAITWPP